MKKRMIQNVVALVMLVVMLFPSVSEYLGAISSSKILYLNYNQMYSTSEVVTRTGSFSKVKFYCDSVYPTSGLDTYRKVQARVASGHYIGISNVGTYTEGYSYDIQIKDGYLLNKEICIQVRGNNPDKDGYVTFRYNPN